MMWGGLVLIHYGGVTLPMKTPHRRARRPEGSNPISITRKWEGNSKELCELRFIYPGNAVVNAVPF
jgi:hypothetical protein